MRFSDAPRRTAEREIPWRNCPSRRRRPGYPRRFPVTEVASRLNRLPSEYHRNVSISDTERLKTFSGSAISPKNTAETSRGC